MSTYFDLFDSTRKNNTNFKCPCCGKNIWNKDYDFLVKKDGQLFKVLGVDQRRELPAGLTMHRVGAKCAMKFDYLKF